MSLKQVSVSKVFDGNQFKFIHTSIELECEMTFSIYIPDRANTEEIPIVFWLSGLTCTDDNFVQKAGAQKFAAQEGLAIVCPDTSPRGENIPDDLKGAYDLGLGASFYINATEKPWSKHYSMYNYITDELPKVLKQSSLPVNTTMCSIMGHSMGGYGALMIALKNPGKYKSVSAFAPICSPMNCQWGEKAFSNYLGDNKKTWKEYDPCSLISNAESSLPILVDQGKDDPFLSHQLKPELLQKVCEEKEYPLTLRFHSGYDHSYFFISTFIEDHIKYHSLSLKVQ